jgi:hypothetical protein
MEVEAESCGAPCPTGSWSDPAAVGCVPQATLGFLFHQQFHQPHASLTDQRTHTLAQPTHHLGQQQDHLHPGFPSAPISSSRFTAPCFNLIWFLHGDSPFLAKDNLLSA